MPFLFAVKNQSDHSVGGSFAASEKGSRYMLHGMKRHTTNIIKKFEAYVLGNIEGDNSFLIWYLDLY